MQAYIKRGLVIPTLSATFCLHFHTCNKCVQCGEAETAEDLLRPGPETDFFFFFFPTLHCESNQMLWVVDWMDSGGAHINTHMTTGCRKSEVIPM